MKQSLLIIMVLIGLSAVALMAVAGPSKQEAEATQRFIEIAKSDTGTFLGNVESAVDVCAKNWDLPSDLSRNERIFFVKFVAKVTYARALIDQNDTLNAEIRRWVKEQIDHNIKDISDRQFRLLTEKVESVLGSSMSTQCIVSTSVSRHDPGAI